MKAVTLYVRCAILDWIASSYMRFYRAALYASVVFVIEIHENTV